MKNIFVIILIFYFNFNESEASFSLKNSPLLVTIEEEHDRLHQHEKFTKRYQPNWESLDSRPLPQWYDDAKIGKYFFNIHHHLINFFPFFRNFPPFWCLCCN